jgi:hypothetical protein
MSNQRRRIYGFIIGFVFGVLYSFISQFINVWMLPGVPLFDLPVGRVETVILTSLSMGIMGLMVTWDEESFWGISGSVFFAVIGSSLLAYLNSGGGQAATSFFLSLFTFLPRLILYLPLVIFFRWLVGLLDETGRAPSSGLMRVLKVALSILIVAVIGGRFSLMAPEAREALQDMNALVLEGMSSVATGGKVPEPLIPVDGFTTFAKGAYTLEWSSDVDSLPVTRPMVGYGVIESLIIVRFETDYQFGCAFTPPRHTPKCINITRVRR